MFFAAMKQLADTDMRAPPGVLDARNSKRMV
jgi:hypothetical protein